MKEKFLLSGLLIIFALSVSAQVPSPRYGHTVCKIGEYYYIFGGALLDDNKKSTKAQPMADIYKYDPGPNSYIKITTSLVPGSDPIPAMFGHTAMNYNGKMYVFNGTRSEATNTSMYILDPDDMTWEQKSAPPYDAEYYVFNGTRSEATADGLCVFAGGYDNTTNAASNECWTYNAENETWSQNNPMSFGGRYAGSSAIIGNKFYVFGGLSDSGPSQTTFVYDIINNMWSWIYPSGFDIYPIYGMITAQLGNSFFICGGGMWSGKKNTQEETNFSTSLYEFQVDTISGNVNIVKRADGLPASLFGAGWIDVESNDTLMYMFGGIQNITTTGDTVLSNNLYRYNLTDEIVQQLDTTTNTWGGVISTINESEFNVSEELSIYPNPASETININLKNNEIINTIKIFNQNGQLVKQITKAENMILNISELTAGIYFLRIDTEKNKYLGRLIKNE